MPIFYDARSGDARRSRARMTLAAKRFRSKRQWEAEETQHVRSEAHRASTTKSIDIGAHRLQQRPVAHLSTIHKMRQRTGEQLSDFTSNLDGATGNPVQACIWPLGSSPETGSVPGSSCDALGLEVLAPGPEIRACKRLRPCNETAERHCRSVIVSTRGTGHQPS